MDNHGLGPGPLALRVDLAPGEAHRRGTGPLLGAFGGESGGAAGGGLLCFFSSRRRHTRLSCDWSSDVCSSDLMIRHTRLSCDWSSDVCSSDLSSDLGGRRIISYAVFC